MVYTIPRFAIGIIEAISFFIILNAVTDKKDNIKNYVYYIGSVVLGLLFNLGYIIFFGSMVNSLYMYLLMLLFSVLFKAGWKKRLLLCLIGLVLNASAETCALYLMAFLFNTTSYNVINDQTLWTGGAITTIIFALLFANMIRVKYKNKKLFLKTSFWVLLVIVFASSLITNFVIFKLMYVIADPFLRNLALGCCIAIVASAFISMYLYEHISKQSELLNREQQYKQQIKSQTKHLDDILVMQNQIKGFRHDIKNHWVVLRGYFQRNDYEGGIQYIDEISDKLISGETIDTGNVALDAIISTKKALAEERNLEFESTVQIPEKMPIDATDICIIFGNSLDNAIEACEKIKDDRKHIKLSVIFEEDAILCKVSNSISKGKKLSMKTTKTDKENHGFGLENIKQALSKYNHVLKIDQTDDEFILSFIIFNK